MSRFRVLMGGCAVLLLVGWCLARTPSNTPPKVVQTPNGPQKLPPWMAHPEFFDECGHPINFLHGKTLAMVDVQAADVNRDGSTDYEDTRFVIAHFTANTARADERICDVDGNGCVDAVDAGLVASVARSVYQREVQQRMFDSGELRPAPFFIPASAEITLKGETWTIPLDEGYVQQLSNEALEAVYTTLHPDRAAPVGREGLVNGVLSDEGNYFTIPYESQDPDTGARLTYRLLMEMTDTKVVRWRDGTHGRVTNDTEVITTTHTDENGNTRQLSTPAELFREGVVRNRFVWMSLTSVTGDGESWDFSGYDVRHPLVLELLRQATAERTEDPLLYTGVVDPSTVPGLQTGGRCVAPVSQQGGAMSEGGGEECTWSKWSDSGPPPCDFATVRFYGTTSILQFDRLYSFGKWVGPVDHGCGTAVVREHILTRLTGFNVGGYADLKIGVKDVWGFGIGGKFNWTKNTTTTEIRTYTFPAEPIPQASYRTARILLNLKYVATRWPQPSAGGHFYQNSVLDKGVGSYMTETLCGCCPRSNCPAPPPLEHKGDDGGT